MSCFLCRRPGGRRPVGGLKQGEEQQEGGDHRERLWLRVQ